MPSLPVSWLDSTTASCSDIPSLGLSVAGEGGLHLRLQLPTLHRQGWLWLCRLLWQRRLVRSARGEAPSPRRPGRSHSNPLRRPSSTCVGMTHLALVLGESLSLIKRHWLQTSQAHFQPLPGTPRPEPGRILPPQLSGRLVRSVSLRGPG